MKEGLGETPDSDHKESLFEQIPGEDLKFFIASGKVAAGLISIGVPPEWKITAVTFGDMAFLVIRKISKQE